MKRPVELDLPAKQVEQLTGQLAEQLDLPAKQRLVAKLEYEMRRARWEPIVTKMRRRFAAHPLSAREIRRICEEVRQERFERRRAAGRH